MAFANFLSAIGPAALSQGGMMGAESLMQQPKKGGGFLGDIGRALGIGGNDGAPKQTAQQRYGGGGLWDVIGRVSDAISATRGAPQSYATSMQQQIGVEKERAAQEGRNALAEWIANPEDMSKWMIGAKADPDAALGLRKTLKEINAPAKRETVEIDGVVFDKNTGEPLFESPYNRIISGPNGEFLEQPRIGIGRSDSITPAQASTQLAGQPPIKPQGMTDDQIWAQAHEAVRNGASADEVFRRLQTWGMKP